MGGVTSSGSLHFHDAYGRGLQGSVHDDVRLLKTGSEIYLRQDSIA